MKKVLALLICLAVFLGFPVLGLTAEAADDTIEIVATVFPAYDWTREIIRDAEGAEVQMLAADGIDMHSFQPGVSDIVKIASCDLFIYVGGESDAWVTDALANSLNPDRKVINLMEILGDSAREEEIVKGMEAEACEEEGPGYDEHVWLSLRNAEVFVRAIAEAVSELDPADAETVSANAEAYIGELNALDAEYEAAVAEGTFGTLLFGDRFPFRYLTEDYGLSYYAAFSGCSAETEASFATIIFLAQKVDELGLHTVLTIDGGESRIAETIVENTSTRDQTIAVLDSMQSVTSAESESGTTYLSVMEKNLEVLREALA